MKKKLIAAGLFLSMFAVLTAEIMDDNGRAGYTGAPGESTCTYSGCHTTYALNSGSGIIELRTGTTNNQYVPGQVYNMQFKVAKSGHNLFGLGVEALDASGNNAGTLSITQSTRTQIKTRTIGAYTRRCVVHTLNGGAGTDSMVFNFNWTAPQSGTVTFYYCGNAANNNGNESGDYIYSGSTVLTPVSSTAINEMENAVSVDVFPNPVHDRCVIRLSGSGREAVSVQLFDLSGKLVKSETSPEADVEWTGLSSLPKGVYLLSARTPNSEFVKRIVLQ